MPFIYHGDDGLNYSFNDHFTLATFQGSLQTSTIKAYWSTKYQKTFCLAWAFTLNFQIHRTRLGKMLRVSKR